MIRIEVWKKRFAIFEKVCSCTAGIIGLYGLLGFPLNLLLVILFLVGFFGMLLSILGYLMMSILEDVCVNCKKELG